MITIKKSCTADSRTCDPSTVSKETLLKSSFQHIADVGLALAFSQGMLIKLLVSNVAVED